MTPSAEKKAWCSPKVERFGSFAEMTQDDFPKGPGSHDQVPFTQNNCPPGQVCPS